MTTNVKPEEPLPATAIPSVASLTSQLHRQIASNIPPAAMAAPRSGAFVINGAAAPPLLVEELPPPAVDAEADAEAGAEVAPLPPATLLA